MKYLKLKRFGMWRSGSASVLGTESHEFDSHHSDSHLCEFYDFTTLFFSFKFYR